MRNRALLIALPAALAAFLLYLAVRGLDWRELARILGACRVGYLAPGCAALTLGCLVRAWRWRVVLSAEKRVRYPAVFWATMAGAMGNNYLPARAGEVIRSVYIGSAAGISNSFVLATALSERVLDALVLCGIGALAMSLLGGAPAIIVEAARLAAAAAAVGFFGIAVLPRLAPRIEAIFRRAAERFRPAAALGRIVSNFLMGMRAFHDRRRLCAFALLTTSTWLVDAAGAVLIARSLDLQLPYLLALLTLAALGLSSGLPSTPGYVGIYQFVAIAVLTPFGFSRSAALAFILVFQASIYAVVTLWGSIGLWKMRGARAAARVGMVSASMVD